MSLNSRTRGGYKEHVKTQGKQDGQSIASVKYDGMNLFVKVKLFQAEPWLDEITMVG